MVLDNLETETEREGKSDDHQTPGGENQQPTTKSQTCSVISLTIVEFPRLYSRPHLMMI